MRLALALQFTVLVALVQGCSSPGTSTTLDPNAGEDTPGDSTGDPTSTGEGEAEGDKSTPAPAPTTDDPGTPAQPPAPPPPPPKSTMTFFITSTGSGQGGGNLGGLAGADKKCQDLAAAVGGGDHTWHAYLSVQGTNAKDRIGTGPWVNQKGAIIAANVDALHAYNFIPSNDLMLDEKGAVIPPTATSILTGSKQDGTALPQTCNNWTSAQGNQQGRVGDAASQSSVILGARWNDSTKSYGCSQNAITQNKGEGRLYCFAID